MKDNEPTAFQNLMDCGEVSLFAFTGVVSNWFKEVGLSDLYILLGYWQAKKILDITDENGIIISSEIVRDDIIATIRNQIYLKEIEVLRKKILSVLPGWSDQEETLARKHLRFLK